MKKLEYPPSSIERIAFKGITMETLKLIANKIINAKNICLFTHINPDGDALGSCFGLKKALLKLDKNVKILLPQQIPDIYGFLEKDFEYDLDNYKPDDFDLKISLDCGSLSRLGEADRLFVGDTINIDHHGSNSIFAETNYVEGNSASCGEVVLKLINILKIPLDQHIATGIYSAIVTDTGGFMFSNTNSNTFRDVAILLDAGVDYYYLNKRLVVEKSYKKLKLEASCVDRMEFFHKSMIAVCILSYQDIKKLNLKIDDIDGLSSIPRSVAGVECGVLMTEFEPDEIKCSLRSDSILNVSEIASRFGGGGHIRASGFSIKADLNDTKNKLIEIIIDSIKRIDR